MTNERMKTLLEKAAETAQQMAELVKNPSSRKRLVDKAQKLAERAKELA